MWCLNAISQQAITWANADPDLCCHMVSPDNNEISRFHIHSLLPKLFNLVDVYELKNKLEFVNP